MEPVADCAAEIQNLSAWLTRLAYNVCMDWLRENSRSSRYVEQLVILHDNSELSADDPGRILVERERHEYLLHLVDALPSSLRRPFILHTFHEMSYRDITNELNLSEVNLRKRVQQARQILGKGWTIYLAEATTHAPSRVISGPLSTTNVETRVAELSNEASRLLQREIAEIRAKIVETRTVQVTLESGVEMSFHIMLDYKPARRQVRIDTLRKYVVKHSRGWKQRLELANLLYATGQWEEAIDEYRQVLERQPKLLDVSVRLGETLRLMERSEEAVAIYEAALTQVRKPATVYHLHGLIDLCRGNYDAAAEAFRQATSLEPRNTIHWHALATAHQLAGRSHEELQAYEEALKIEHNDIVALTNSHNALFPAGRPLEARLRLERVVELDPNFVLALKLLAACRAGAGLVEGEEGKRTERLLKRALRLAPEAADVWEDMALFYIRKGEWGKAIATLQKFVEDHPQSADGWFYFAKWLGATGDFTNAVDAIMKSLDLYQHEYFMYHEACLLLPEAGRFDELRRVLEETLQRFPGHWVAYKIAALSLVQWLNEPERACELSLKTIQLQPELPEAWANHGQVLALAGRHEAAIAALLHAVELSPQSREDAYLLVAVAYQLGKCYRALKDFQKSRLWFEKAVSLAPGCSALSPADGPLWLGKALEELGETSAALQAYSTALQRRPLYMERQEAEAAIERLRKSKNS